MNKILVIQTAFIGDVILATSLVESIHQEYPKAQIDFLLRKGNESLLKDHPFLNRVLIWEKKESKYGSLLQLLKQIRKERYELVVNAQRFGATGALAAFSNATAISGFKKNPFSRFFTHRHDHKIGDGTHEIERNFSLLSSFFSEGTRVAPPRLYPSGQDFEAVEYLQSEEYICVAPTSVWFTKQWPAHKWIEFINLVPTNITVYLLGGPGDQAECEKIEKASQRENVANLAGKLSFLQSAALMQKARRNFVNDSGPLHIASATNVPSTALFCSTIPEFGFGPLSSDSTVIEIKEKLPCRPCGLHGKKACPKKHFKCAENIDSKDLLATL